MKKKYSYAFFKRSYSDDKRSAESPLSRFFYRPVSFAMTPFFANRGASANAVSYIGLLLDAMIVAAFLFGTHVSAIVGACLVALWNIVDCVDGALARSIAKHPLGEFVDACGSYLLVGFLFSAVGVAVYHLGGFLVGTENVWMVYVGAIASASDTMSRLMYQKYLNCESSIGSVVVKKVADSDSTGQSFAQGKIRRIINVIDNQLGLGGLMVPLLIVCAMFNWLDVFLIAYGCFYFCSFVGTACVLFKKVHNRNDEIVVVETETL